MSPASARSAGRQPKILFCVTSSVTARAFLRGQLKYLGTHGWQVHLVHGDAADVSDFAAQEDVVTHRVPMSRDPHWRDPVAVLGLVSLLARLRPTVVVMGTPKMGTFGVVAAAVALVRRRIYLVHGLRWEGLGGAVGRATRLLDRVACRLATDVVVVSPSVRERLVRERIAPSAKIRLLGSGSANGVDVRRFTPGRMGEARAALGIPTEARVVSFVGRLTADKGVHELEEIWRAVSGHDSLAWLVIAGEDEKQFGSLDGGAQRLAKLERVRLLGRRDDVETVYQAADVHLMLSKREGLGMVVLEAAACEVPAVGFASTGVVDAVVDGVTGLLCPPGDSSGAISALSTLLRDNDLRSELGRAARRRVEQMYSQELVWQSWSALLSEAHAAAGPRDSRDRKVGA